MRETKFIQQNKGKWKDFERILKFKKKDPEKLSKLFIQITDDLSYSRTFYPNRSVRVYLNNLAQQIFYSVYKNKKSNKGRFKLFWTDELPQLVWEARKEMLTSFLVFALAFIIGALSCANDPDFIRTILGDRYVDMTIEFIESGDPMAVYKQENEVDMSFGITYNNAMVAFRTFIMGALFAIGTIAIMISNGIMIGSFHYFMYEKGVLAESLSTVWIHGTLEISAIIIAGAAGLTMGRGLIFPGTYSRLQSFQLSAKRGLKIMLGILPIIILAGFIEGFVTRYTEAPTILKIGIILASLSFVLTYFVWYPWRKAKFEGFETEIDKEKLPPNKSQNVRFSSIRTGSDIFTDTFVMYRKNFKHIFWVAIASSIVFSTVMGLYYQGELRDEIYYESWTFFQMIDYFDLSGIESHFLNLFQLFDFDLLDSFIIFPNILIFGTVFYLAILSVMREMGDTIPTLRKDMVFHATRYFNTLLLTGVFMCFYGLIELGWAVFWLTILSPFILLWMFIAVKENRNIFSAIGQTFYLLGNGVFNMVGTYFTFMLLSFILTFIVGSEFLWSYIEYAGWNVELNEVQAEMVMDIFVIFLFVWVLSLLIPVFTYSIGLYYSSYKEVKEAVSLKKSIYNIGIKNRAYGLEKES